MTKREGFSLLSVRCRGRGRVAMGVLDTILPIIFNGLFESPNTMLFPMKTPRASTVSDAKMSCPEVINIILDEPCPGSIFLDTESGLSVIFPEE